MAPEWGANPGLLPSLLACKLSWSSCAQPCGRALLCEPAPCAQSCGPCAFSWQPCRRARGGYLRLASRHHQSTRRRKCRHKVSLKPCVLTYSRPSSALERRWRSFKQDRFPRLLMHPERQNYWLSSNILTLFGCPLLEILQIFSGQMAKRPELELFVTRLFTPQRRFHSFCPHNSIRCDLLLVWP